MKKLTHLQRRSIRNTQRIDGDKAAINQIIAILSCSKTEARKQLNEVVSK